MSFLLGADPEVFVAKNGRFEPATGLVPGTKTAPHPVPHGAVQVDGLALEFNIDPASSYDEFQNNLDVVMTMLQAMVPQYEIQQYTSVQIGPLMKERMPPEALIRGCSPDLNAYTEENNPSPDEACNIHAAGGHLHIGNIFSEGETEQQRYKKSLRLARLMDKYVGVYSLLWDKDTLRRQVYGKAGSLRLKDYGMEYRTLSNAWLFNKKITKLVYEGTAHAVHALNSGEDVDNESYRHIIDNGERHSHFFVGNFFAERVKEALVA